MPATAQVGRIMPASTTAFGANPNYDGMEWRSEYAPRYHVYVYNISGRTFKNVGRINLTIPGIEPTSPVDIVRPIIDPKTKAQVGTEIVNGKPEERYRLCTSFPQPILIPEPDDQSLTIKTREQDALRYVVDLLQPDNLGRALVDSLDPAKSFSQGTNLAEKGVFFSISNPPLEADLKAAYRRMEKYYNSLLEQAGALELTDKAKLSESLAGNPDYGFAADYFGKSFQWHKPNVRPVECPNCGEPKPVGRKFHLTSFGVVCVEQTVEAWRAAVNSGVKTLDSVPPDFRWVKPEPVKSVIPTLAT